MLADIDEEKLKAAANSITAIVGDANVLTVKTDVSKLEEVERLKDKAYEAFGEVCEDYERYSLNFAHLNRFQFL